MQEHTKKKNTSLSDLLQRCFQDPCGLWPNDPRYSSPWYQGSPQTACTYMLPPPHIRTLPPGNKVVTT